MAEMNRLARWMVNRRTEGRAARAVSRLGDHLALPRGATVLELGCGGGGLAALLQERWSPARLVATDVDPRQLGATREFLTARWGRIPATLELASVDALELPMRDGEFDAVFAMMMLHHVEQHHTDYARRPAALREIRRVLRPRGRLVYSELFRRRETRASLSELGFEPEFLRSGWRVDLAIYRAPGPPGEVGVSGEATAASGSRVSPG